MIAADVAYNQRMTAFFDVLQQKRSSHAASRRYTDRYLSTGFNVFDLIYPGENQVSDIMREILRPDGSHGQGDVFLKAFVTHMFRTHLDPKGSHGEVALFLKAYRSRSEGTEEPRDAQVHVHREWRTTYIASTVRRIDIVIDGGAFGIGIENKLGAADQADQVSDYQHELRHHFAHSCLVYLTPYGKAPSAESSTSPTDDGHLKLMSYSTDVQDWLDVCRKECESEKYRWFLRDFQAHLKRRVPVPTGIEAR